MSKILIIDDEEAILKMYSEALNKHEVLTAKDGKSGVEIAQQNHPDLILLDIILPKVNGLDVLAQLKNNQETATIPVIMLTNLPEEASGDKAQTLGADKYFVKAEYEPEKLSLEVNKLLSDEEE